jgi:hypothetical protein
VSFDPPAPLLSLTSTPSSAPVVTKTLGSFFRVFSEYAKVL